MSAEDVIIWLGEAAESTLSESTLNEYYQTVSPRVVFLKNLERGSRLLDLGAGGGELAILREWPSFPRPDLRLFAVSLEQGKLFDRYEEVSIGNFEESLPQFTCSQFEAILCAHFIEHVRDLSRAIGWMADQLTSNGRAYVEWPHERSKSMPRRSDLMKLGYSVSTTNFFDDATHVEAWGCDEIAAEAARHGFEMEAWGRITMPFIAEQMRNYAVRHREETMLTFAIWAFVGWAQYVIMRKTG